MKIQSYTATHAGRVRANNQDAHFADDANRVYAVADGIGGYAAGEVASTVAVAEVRKCAGALSAAFDAREALEVVFERAHRRVLAAPYRQMGRGTTLTACLIEPDGTLRVGAAGDSPCLLFRAGRAEVVLGEERYGHALSNCLGVRPEAYKGMRYAERTLAPGDVVVLCTDGLTDYAGTPEQLARGMGRIADGRIADALVDLALAGGGGDNVTVVAIRVLA